jgi:anthranilate/para-aminobenzoate synthase component I
VKNGNHYPHIIPSARLKQGYARGTVVPLVTRLPFRSDPWSIAKRVTDRPNVFFLDSVRFQEKTARYSYLGWEPFRVFRAGKSKNPLGPLKKMLGTYQGRRWAELPFFLGGAVGYFSYELGRNFESIPDHAADDLHLDRLTLLFIRDLIVFDQKTQHCYLVANLVPSIDGSFDRALKRATRVIEKYRTLIASDNGAVFCHPEAGPQGNKMTCHPEAGPQGNKMTCHPEAGPQGNKMTCHPAIQAKGPKDL